MPSDPTTRIQRLQDYLKEKKLDAFLVREVKNRLYLSGFNSSEGIMLVTRKKAYLFLDGRYIELGRKLVRGVEVLQFQGHLESLFDTVRKDKLKKVGYEQDKFAAIFLERMQKETKVKMAGEQQLIEKLRMIKDADEIRCLQKASKLSDEILRRAKRRIKAGMTEKDLHVLLKRIALDVGALEWSFATIIGVNGNAAYPHYMLIDDLRKLKQGDVILIDMGVSFQNYQSDITRVFFLGPPSKEIGEMYQKVLRIQEETIRSVRVGKTFSETILSFEKKMKDEKILQYMTHSLSHGVGLDVHELPYISSKHTQKWEEGIVFTIEPGVYKPGKYGIRIEDTCLLTAKGPVTLNHMGKRLQDCVL